MSPSPEYCPRRCSGSSDTDRGGPGRHLLDGPDLADAPIRMDDRRPTAVPRSRLNSPGYAPLLADSPEPGQPSAVRHHVADEGELVGLAGSVPCATGLMLRLKLVIGRPAPGWPPPTDRAGTRPARRNDASRKRWTDGAASCRGRPTRSPTAMQRGTKHNALTSAATGVTVATTLCGGSRARANGRRRYRSGPGRRRCATILPLEISRRPGLAALQPMCCRRNRDRRVRYGLFHLCPDRNLARPLTQDLHRVAASTL